jgi:hypothetical protein
MKDQDLNAQESLGILCGLAATVLEDKSEQERKKVLEKADKLRNQFRITADNAVAEANITWGIFVLAVLLFVRDLSLVVLNEAISFDK